MRTQPSAGFSILQIAIVLLTLATAFIHFSLNFPDPIFILNGVGYLGLLGMLYLPIPQLAPARSLIRRALIIFTLLTIVLWLGFGARTTIGYIDKLIEVVLIILLVIEARSEAKISS